MTSGGVPSEDSTRAIAVFVDALLPGDGVFPSASDVGAHGVLAMRLRETVGSGAAEALAAAFIARGGLEAPEAAAASLEAGEPALFDAALTALYYAYYETPRGDRRDPLARPCLQRRAAAGRLRDASVRSGPRPAA